MKLAEIQARENNIKVNLMNKDAIDTGFDGDSFDFVFTDQVVEHIKDTNSFLREIYRVLKPGGLAFFSFPNKYRIREVHCDGLLFVSYLPNFIATIYLCIRNKRKWRYAFLPWGVWHRRPGKIRNIMLINGFKVIYDNFPESDIKKIYIYCAGGLKRPEDG